MAKAITTDVFVTRANKVHGDKYDYSQVKYVNMKTKVAIICRIHGVFYQLPQPHLKGQGCPICGREKQKQTVLRKYGVDNPMKCRSVYDKARQTCLEKYGYAWARSNPDIQKKCVETNQLLRGVSYPLQDANIKMSVKQTVYEKYGVTNVGQVKEFREKARNTCLERYGCEEPLSSDMIREKIKKTNRLRYGGVAPMHSDVVKAKTRQTWLSHYNVDHIMKSEDVLLKIQQTKLKNHTFHTSRSEDVLYKMLCEYFGVTDVVRQYTSEKYPFACDFYIQSRDLYIELNAHWSHGACWFEQTQIHMDIVNLWKARGTSYYDNAIHVWCQADVKKRAYACRYNLNYVVFWMSDLSDAKLWFDADCPDGCDWFCEYSWKQ